MVDLVLVAEHRRDRPLDFDVEAGLAQHSHLLDLLGVGLHHCILLWALLLQVLHQVLVHQVLGLLGGGLLLGDVLGGVGLVGPQAAVAAPSRPPGPGRETPHRSVAQAQPELRERSRPPQEAQHLLDLLQRCALGELLLLLGEGLGDLEERQGGLAVDLEAHGGDASSSRSLGALADDAGRDELVPALGQREECGGLGERPRPTSCSVLGMPRITALQRTL